MSESKALKPIDELRGNLTRMEPQFAMVLPKSIPAEKFVRVVMTAVQGNPDILNADRNSLFSSALKCATDGLLPDGRQAALIVRGGKVSYEPMVAGYCVRARNSGEISSIDAVVVYQNDEYDAWVDEKGQHFLHRKAKGDRGEVLLTYAYAITKDGGFYFEEIDEKQMQAIEAVSRAKTGPWKGDFKDEMRRKSAIKRLGKYRLPSSTDLESVIRHDDEGIDFSPPPVPGVKKTSRLEKALGLEAPDSENAKTTQTTAAAQGPSDTIPSSPNPVEDSNAGAPSSEGG